MHGTSSHAHHDVCKCVYVYMMFKVLLTLMDPSRYVHKMKTYFYEAIFEEPERGCNRDRSCTHCIMDVRSIMRWIANMCLKYQQNPCMDVTLKF